MTSPDLHPSSHLQPSQDVDLPLSTKLLIAFLVFLTDQLLKLFIINSQHRLPLEIIPGIVKIAYAENTGIAFGLFQNNNLLFILIGIAVLALIIKYHDKLEIKSKMEGMAISLILGGTAGNVFDRVFRGSVIDYIQLPGIPTFNVADAALTTGAALIIAAFLREKIKKRFS